MFESHISVLPSDCLSLSVWLRLQLTHCDLFSIPSICDLSQVKDYRDRALDIHLKKVGPENVDVVNSRALAIRLKKVGPDDVDVAILLQFLSILHDKLGELSQAKDYHDRALAIRLKKLGPDDVDIAILLQFLGILHDVDIAILLQFLGILHDKLGELSQAKDYYDRAQAIRVKKLGAEEVDIAIVLHFLGILHDKLGELIKRKF